MIALKVAELAQILGGRLVGDGENLISGEVETDSRLITAGSLFFAKPGEVADGHDFAFDAKTKGAAALVVERELDIDLPQVIVKNSVEALAVLATWLIRELKAKGKLM